MTRYERCIYTHDARRAGRGSVVLLADYLSGKAVNRHVHPLMLLVFDDVKRRHQIARGTQRTMLMMDCLHGPAKTATPQVLANTQLAFMLLFVSTAREIEEAIRSLPLSERNKLLHDIPDLFPELSRYA